MKCYEECKQKNKCCQVKECRLWIDYPEDLNCTFIVVEKHGALTLQEASKRAVTSHVRVKQIQDQAVKKVEKLLNKDKAY